MKKIVFYFLFITKISFAQSEPDKIYMPNIHTPQLFLQGNQYGYPIISVGSIAALELHFDDFDGYVKNYNYTFQLCNADWTEVNLSPFDYLKGFTQNRLSQYRVSSVAKVKYVHYQALLPEQSSVPIKSGNYLLKVFLNGDTSQLAFTKRVLIVNNIVTIGASIQQPFNQEFFKTHQKVQFSIDVSKLNLLNQQQQLKVVVLQNYRWDNAVKNMQPEFMRGNMYEYNGERDFLFPAGKEYRWVDLRSFRFQSERVKNVDMKTVPFDVELFPDGERTQERYLYYPDRNGFYEISSTDLINPWWQGDYANVHFSFVPKNNIPYPDKNVYIIGQFTNYFYNDSTKLDYNATKGIYEKTLLLKQGYYTYTYATKDIKNLNAISSVENTDGNTWETENNYTILVYYRSFSDRSDGLVGIVTINSRTSRTGF
ncbi:MAG: DUF5103 domain-containing protein [Chitinophagaceae bacterium]